MSKKRVFSVSKYEFLKAHASCILEMMLKDVEEMNPLDLDREFLLLLLDYLTVSKYHDYAFNEEKVVFHQQTEFEESILLIEKNLEFKEEKNPYEEIQKILTILKLNAKNLLSDENESDNDHMIHATSALKMYEEYNLEKKQSKEVTYGKHHK